MVQDAGFPGNQFRPFPGDVPDPVGDLHRQLQEHDAAVAAILRLSQDHPGAIDDALGHINEGVAHTHRDIVRVFRIIQYVGDRAWVEKTIRGSIHSSKVVEGKGVIYVTSLQEFPEIVSYVPMGWDLKATFHDYDTEEDPRRDVGLDTDAAGH